MAPKKKAAKRTATKKSEVQTDRQRSKSSSEEPGEQIEGTEETAISEYQPRRTPLKDYDHVSIEEQRQAELAAEREEHNRRTGDASLRREERQEKSKEPQTA